MCLSGALNFISPSRMFYRQQLVISLIYWKTCRVNKQGEEKKSKASGGSPHLQCSWVFMSKFKSNINYRHLERTIIICHSWWQDDISCLDVSALPFASSRAQAVMITISDKLRRWVGHFGCVCAGEVVWQHRCVLGPSTDEKQTGIFIMSNF